MVQSIQRVADTIRPFTGAGHILFIVNPVSGHKQGRELFQRVKPMFEHAKVPIKVRSNLGFRV